MPPFTRQGSRVELVIETETSSKGVMKNVTKKQLKRGLWRPEEDLVLKNYVQTHGEGNWASVSEKSGLMRGGKSCRLRWKNYLRPNIKRGGMSEEEEDLIIRMHKLLGNRWSLIAGRLPGRTDNEVKNYWNTHLSKGNTHSSLRNLRGKRKAINSSHRHHSNKEHEDAKIFTSNKRPCPLSDPLEPSCSTTSSIAPKHDGQGRDDGRKEDTAVTVFSTDHPSWIEDLKRFSYGDKESNSLLINYATLGIDDDPFIPYFDSFLLFGSLDFNVDTDYMNPTRY